MSIPAIQDGELRESLYRQVAENRLNAAGDLGGILLSVESVVVGFFSERVDFQQKIRRELSDNADRFQMIVRDSCLEQRVPLYRELLGSFTLSEIHEIVDFSKLDPVKAAVLSIRRVKLFLLSQKIFPKYQGAQGALVKALAFDAANRTTIRRFCDAEAAVFEAKRGQLLKKTIQSATPEVINGLTQELN